MPYEERKGGPLRRKSRGEIIKSKNRIADNRLETESRSQERSFIWCPKSFLGQTLAAQGRGKGEHARGRRWILRVEKTRVSLGTTPPPPPPPKPRVVGWGVWGGVGGGGGGCWGVGGGGGVVCVCGGGGGGLVGCVGCVGGLVGGGGGVGVFGGGGGWGGLGVVLFWVCVNTMRGAPNWMFFWRGADGANNLKVGGGEPHDQAEDGCRKEGQKLKKTDRRKKKGQAPRAENRFRTSRKTDWRGLHRVPG